MYFIKKIIHHIGRVLLLSHHLLLAAFTFFRARTWRHIMVVVVARYNENIFWTRFLNCSCVVYNKGKELPHHYNAISLPNVGREAHTYLTYIIDNYDNLPGYVAFIQGHPFDHSKMCMHTINRFDPREGFTPLSDHWLVVYPGADNAYPVKEFSQKIYGKVLPKYISPVGAQFIVARERILFHPKEAYEYLRSLLIQSEKGTRCAYPTFHTWTCSCGEENSAYVFERFWGTIFDEKTPIILPEHYRTS